MHPVYTIIPDVHGRPFWRDAVRDVPDVPVVFLGDYLDPYPHERVTWEDAWQGFQDILALKRKYPDRVTLLLGNHEVHYFPQYPWSRTSSRYDEEHDSQIREALMSNLELFDLAMAIPRSDGRPFVLTHAGITDQWVDEVSRHIERNRPELFDYAVAINNASRKPAALVDFLNETLHTSDERLFNHFIWTLSSISSARGGRETGSPVWADIDDTTRWDRRSLRGCIQIVGHTRQPSIYRMYANRFPPQNVYCVDCGRAFTLEPTAEKFLRFKNELKSHFHFSDILSAPECLIFGTWLWHLTPTALEEARQAIAEMVRRHRLIPYEEGTYYVRSIFMDDPPEPYDWVVAMYEEAKPAIAKLKPGEALDLPLFGDNHYLFTDPMTEFDDNDDEFEGIVGRYDD